MEFISNPLDWLYKKIAGRGKGPIYTGKHLLLGKWHTFRLAKRTSRSDGRSRWELSVSWESGEIIHLFFAK